MNRQPSIHIIEKDIALVLQKLFESNNIVTKLNYTKLARQFCSISRPYSIVNRTVNISNDRIEKKALKLLSSSRLDSDIFANLLYHYRKSLKHRGITPIRPGSKEWDSLKFITSQAISFCNDFNLEKKEGFMTYIKLGLQKMKKYSLYKFNNLHEGICNTYEAMKELQLDEDPTTTLALYKYYTGYIARKTGVVNDYEKNLEKYVCFKRVREESEKLGVSGYDYIKAQFYGLDFTGGIPDPLQLVGEKAIERLNKFLFKFGNTQNKMGLDLDKIKRA